MLLFKNLTILFFLFITPTVSAQSFTRQDSLRGTLNAFRSCYDVSFYDLNVRVNPQEKSIKGYNTIHFKVLADFKKLQVDLFENMKIDKILHRGVKLNYMREGNAVFINFSQKQLKNQVDSIQIYYTGNPKIAKNPPWDGGFSWEKDSLGYDWVGVSCEGIGASLWWPNKDHLSDEPDSMRIRCEVPTKLMCVANGNLRGKKDLKDNYTSYEWFVSYPINNYNVTLNIGNYTHFEDTYRSKYGHKLALDYYVLSYNLKKAKRHFQQVKPMLACYEKFFGKYPFWKDGYALVETSYWGMEHQGAIAYGNKYKNNEFGFDFIIIHESGHEYWGNSVSVKDHGEMWIHEGFCTYAEFLYLECTQGYETALKYLRNQKQFIKNKQPILGHLEVNYEGWDDADMYYKGAWMLHTLRNIIDNDKLWFELIYELAQTFKIKNVTSLDIISFINKKTGKDFTYFFEQYLKTTQIPLFSYKISQNELQYCWKNVGKDFKMPLKVKINKKEKWIYPTTQWKQMKAKDFEVLKDRFYIEIENNIR